MNYQDFTVRDFLLDDHFCKWVMEPDQVSIDFWKKFLEEHPDKLRETRQARDVLLLIRFREHDPEEGEREKTWERIEQTIRRKIIAMPPPVRDNPVSHSSRPGRRSWLRYAAALTGFLVLISLAFYSYYKTPARHSTAYGETKTIVLPDHSIVKLNANSTLRYSRNWEAANPREIWLNGEAFFSVVHKSNDQQFLVHTDDVTVQVRGTEFNVNSRHIATKVVLNNGSVRLFLNPAGEAEGTVSEGTVSKGAGSLIMEPGDLVSWSSRTGKLLKKKVDPELYSSWRTNILTFKDTPITEVVRSLRDNFGLTIRIEDKDIRRETFTGTIPMDNVEIFFKTLSRTFDVEIIRKDGEIFLVKK